jgi:transposase
MLPAIQSLGLLIRLVRLDGDTVVIHADGTATSARCPSCHTSTSAVHDRYERRPLDLPWRGRVVQLHLTVRRFRCQAHGCVRRTFAEDFDPALRRRARRTSAALGLLTTIALTAGAEAGARLARASGLPVSPDTLLRLLRGVVLPETTTPRVLGVDDLALRRGQRYATIFIDLETHRPVDLVPGREADMLAAWLRAHPGVEVIARDRAEAYVQGARDGAPAAVQVADRFHLLQNASAALDEVLRSRRRRIEIAAPTLDPSAAPFPPAAMAEERPLSRTKLRERQRRARRVARWERVRALHGAGVSISSIARQLAIDPKTVRRLAMTPEPPRNLVVQPRPGGLTSPTLQPFVDYLQDRWQQGCQNISRLCREIAAQGYTGSRSLVAQALLPWRPPRPPPTERRRLRRLSVRWLCLRPPEQLDTGEQQALQGVLASDQELARGYTLLQRFRALVAGRDGSALDVWLADAHASDLPSFAALANGIRADRAAVEAALVLPWSTGPVEGHVHRLKLIKRQGYGRAKLDLLRQRVLAS